MAKIKYSALVSDMRNKLNGSVLSKNRYGNYVRNKVTPINPQTDFQQAQRSRLSAASQAWKTLSQSARNAFATLAQSHPLTNIFGDQVTLDGKAMFTRLSLNLLTIGQSPLTAAPNLKGVPFVEVLSATFDKNTGETEIAINQPTVPAGYSLVVEATPPMSKTINFVKNAYRTLGAFTAVGGDVDLQVAYPDRFPSYNSGTTDASRVHVRVFLVDTATGEAGLASGIAADVVS